jgi:hypothetical protein
MRVDNNCQKKSPTLSRSGFFVEDGVAVTYFRVRKRHTIIGANSFHGPVRDGKAWFQAAVAATKKNEEVKSGSPTETLGDDNLGSDRAKRVPHNRAVLPNMLTVIGSSRTGN